MATSKLYSLTSQHPHLYPYFLLSIFTTQKCQRFVMLVLHTRLPQRQRPSFKMSIIIQFPSVTDPFEAFCSKPGLKHVRMCRYRICAAWNYERWKVHITVQETTGVSAIQGTIFGLFLVASKARLWMNSFRDGNSDFEGCYHLSATAAKQKRNRKLYFNIAHI